MVSTRLIQAVVLFMTAATVTAAPPMRFSVGPRIPSHSKHMEVLKARSNEVDLSSVIETTCLDPEQ